jgi:hypothetical protein
VGVFAVFRLEGKVVEGRWSNEPWTLRAHYDYRCEKYAPVVAKHLGAELDIIFLRHQAKGQLIGDGGDIDNRLKTLFDALRVPSKGEVDQLGTAVTQDEDPLHCLLQDDRLIHRVNVETDRLLKDADPRSLMAIIQVTVVVTYVTFDTVMLTGS